MGGHPMWPDKVEQDLTKILADVKAEQPQLTEKINRIVDKLELLIDEGMAEVLAIKKLREQTFKDG